ncbi:uncharacterized protein [Diadema setosum]|uniref:uncharacterized protein n=1 Tax=Diadema setosum TaxID=31175 RepID=UPI003B3AF420
MGVSVWRSTTTSWCFSLILLSITSCYLDNVAIATPRGIPAFHSNGNPIAPGEDMHGGIPMGVSNEKCDDGKTNLTIDWNGDIRDYECTIRRWDSNKNKPKGDISRSPFIEYCTENLDNPTHVCMNRAIVYDYTVPTSGAHRPLWAKYGEYRYLPKQRWLHNMEHGAAVFLYHPCADLTEIEELKEIARSCLRKHIITPFRDLPQNLPFVVLTYGCKLELPYIDAERVRNFLRENANKRDGPHSAPEWRVSRDGQFDHGLLYHAQVVSDVNDCVICPTSTFEGCPRPRPEAGEISLKDLSLLLNSLYNRQH